MTKQILAHGRGTLKARMDAAWERGDQAEFNRLQRKALAPEKRRLFDQAQAKLARIAREGAGQMLEQSKPGGRAPSPYFENLARRQIQIANAALARHALAVSRLDKARTAAPTSKRVARSSRAPRRPRTSPARRAKRVDSDDGPAPELADQRSASRFGFTPRALIAVLKRLQVPFVRDRRRFLFRPSDLLAALGLPLSAPVVSTAPSDFGSAQYVALRLVGGGSKGGRK